MDRKISLSVSTHNGKRKNNNEDSFSINHKAKPSDEDIMNICGDISDSDLFLGVFDGMGGEKMGDVASRIAAERAAELYKQLKELTPDMFQQAIDKYVNETNAKICITLENCGDDRGGTTMAAVFIKNGMVENNKPKFQGRKQPGPNADKVMQGDQNQNQMGSMKGPGSF